MGRYMIFRNGPCMVPIIAVDNSDEGRYTLHIDKDNEVKITPSQERKLMFHLYQQENETAFAGCFQKLRSGGFSALEIDKAIEAFKRDHPKIALDRYEFKDVPLYGSTEEAIDLPITYYCCSLPAKYEQEFMQMLVDEPYRETFEKLKNEFEGFCHKYSLDYRFGGTDPYEELAKSFLQQHGIPMLYDLPSSPKVLAEEEKAKKKKTTRVVLYFVVLALAAWGAYSDSWACPICAICGVIWVAIPISVVILKAFLK